MLGFYDVSRAHWHAAVRRNIYVKPPKEDTSILTGIAKLLKSMYGTRDAAQCWDAFCEEVMTALEFTVGVYSVCVYHHRDKDAVCVRHGDDFILLAPRHMQKWFHEEINKRMQGMVKHLGSLGPRSDLGDVQEVRCLNRIIRWVYGSPRGGAQDHVEWEADPRHIEILCHALFGDKAPKKLSTPGEKMPKNADTTVLNERERQLYRSNTMRMAYLASDRPELPFCSKELARSMQQPTQWDMKQLRRGVQFLSGARRLVQKFVAQHVPTRVTGYSDTDHAGCIKTRKSTSSSMMFLGKHMVKSSASTQAVQALSSGESEFYGAVKTASTGIGMIHLLKDMGVDMQEPLDLKLDASAGIGIAQRRGAGWIRHIATPTLWLQKAVYDGKVKVGKVDGKENPADIGTKYLGRKAIEKIWKRCGFYIATGSSKMALKAALSS